MNSGLFDSSTAFGNDWEAAPDASEFLYDSPVPHSQDLSQLPGSAATPTPSGNNKDPAVKQEAKSTTKSHLAVPDAISQQSSNSTSDSRSSSSASPNQPKLTSASPSSLPTFHHLTNPSDLSSHGAFGRMDTMFTEEDQNQFGLASGYPSVNSEMDHLSLNTTTGSFDFSTGAGLNTNMDNIFANTANERDIGLTPRTLGAIKNAQSMNASPVQQMMTVSPQKMFSIGSREDSPNDMPMNSGQSSPFPLNSNSPIGSNTGQFGGDQGQSTIDSTMGASSAASKRPLQDAAAKTQDVKSTSAASTSNAKAGGSQRRAPLKQWPCSLTVDPTPEKSRVETQIPIKLTLRNPPPGFTRLHLPGYTISKPKFQQKPPFEGDQETLELSVLLVCASAMQSKEEAVDRAFARAEDPEPPVQKAESPASQDEDDPERPLNGGPVAICAGCIIRERKRANRKKNKKVEEEEEWQKDEAKRVIVFNCQEIKDWCVSGSKETPIKDHSGPVDSMFVNVPMRIACYCRHQSEKVGFQVIFTVRTPTGEILAQGMSQSIMITDDHKQPPPSQVPIQQAQQNTQAAFNPQAAFMFPHHPTQQYQSQSPTGLPFRPSFSVPNLSAMTGYQQQQQQQSQQQQLPQQQQQQQRNGLGRQFSSGNLSSQNTKNPPSTSATPRTLSRPASPTDPAGQPGPKKRRSGGSGHAKMSSGLSMTKIDTKKTSPPGSGGLTAASTPGNFSFASPTNSSFTNTPLDGTFPQQAHMRHPSHYYGGASTPSIGQFPQDTADYMQYYSAPTSQHQSRAPSPSNRFGAQFHPGMMQNSVPIQAASILASLPPGLSLNKPPMIQRLIPESGSVTGGSEVTVLGAGFIQGLEVMFGDKPAASSVLWGDTTIVAQAPASNFTGPVNVVFKHQHPSSNSHAHLVPALMPTAAAQYYYTMPNQSYNSGMMFANANGTDQVSAGQSRTMPAAAMGSGQGSPISGSPNMDDGGGMPGGVAGMRGFYAPPPQGTSPATANSRQAPGSAGFNAAAQARRAPLSRTVSGDANAFRR